MEDPILTVDVWDQPAEPRAWVIENLLPAHRVTLLSGPGGTGKSRLALQLAAAVAVGVPRWVASPSTDNPVPPLDVAYARVEHHVIYASYEDECEEFQRRLQGFVVQDDQDQRKLTEGVGWHDVGDGSTLTRALAAMRTFGYYPATDVLWRYNPPAAEGVWTETGAHLWKTVDECRQTRDALLIIDSAAAAWAGNENSRTEVRAFLSALDQRAQGHHTTVLLLSHPPKQPGHAYSGSTDWINANRMVWSLGEADTSISVGSEGKGKGKEPCQAMRLSVVKSNYGPLAAWWLQRTRDLWRGASERDAAIAHWLSSGKGRLPESLGGHPKNGGA